MVAICCYLERYNDKVLKLHMNISLFERGIGKRKYGIIKVVNFSLTFSFYGYSHYTTTSQLSGAIERCSCTVY